MNYILRYILAFTFLCTVIVDDSKLAQADTIHGKIVGISDGDTVTLLDPTYRQHKIRLGGIDAREKSQPFGDASKKSLSDIIYGKIVDADCIKYDKYGRQVCKILIDGLDVNLAQIREGFAWHFKKYENDQPVEDRSIYAEAEKFARSSKAGLWVDSNPIPPWEFRHGDVQSDNVTTDLPEQLPPKPLPPIVPNFFSGSNPNQKNVSPPVKLSRTGICHALGSSYYNKTINYRPFPTIEACLVAGGRLPKR